MSRWCDFCQTEHTSMSCYHPGAAKYKALFNAHSHEMERADMLQQRVEELTEKYHDLLYQVAIKHPGESRHDTAKRYIRLAEKSINETEAVKKVLENTDE